MDQVHDVAFGFQMTDEVVEAGAAVLRPELAHVRSDYVQFSADVARRVFTAMVSVEGSIKRISDDLAAVDAVEVTPEMAEAGREAIGRRWHDFVGVGGHRILDEVLREVFLAMWAAQEPNPSGSIKRISEDNPTAFVPTDADVESLAVCLYACMYEHSFATGKRLLWQSLPSEISYSWHRVARAAFDHAGYLPSITAARRDALSTYTYERRQHATETATWKDRCGNLEAQLKVSPRERSDNNLSQPCPYRAYVPGSMPLLEAAMAQSADFQRVLRDGETPRERSDVWVATGPDTALPIDGITRLIEIAHETKDPELRKLATNAAAVLLHPHCPMASA